jgi:hypothetical protein
MAERRVFLAALAAMVRSNASDRDRANRLALTPVSEREREIFQQNYDSIREMPSNVFAARIVTELIARPRRPDEMTVIIAGAIDAMRAEYRKEGEKEKLFCEYCDVVTLHTADKLVGINPEAGDLILRCDVCGKVEL